MVIVKTKDKEYEIKEVKYKDVLGQDNLAQANPASHAKNIMKLATGMTDEEYDNLSMKDGLSLQQSVDSVNGFKDFQKPLKE